MSVRPRRSVLYMPGSNQRALEKAKTLVADTVIFDLEDSVGPDMKVAAREQVMAAVNAGGYGAREVIVRANSLDTEWGRADIEAIAASAADGLCLPKIEHAEQLLDAIAIMRQGGSSRPLALWPMIETPLGVQNVNAIAGADPAITVLVMGTTDLAKELRVPHTADRIGLQYSLGRCVLAARRFAIDILDGVYLDLDDEPGFNLACEQGRALGFDGKTLIHPKQLATANRVFGISERDLARAEKIIAAWKAAELEGKGVVVVDGKLVEGMHVDEARRQLDLAVAIDALEAV